MNLFGREDDSNRRRCSFGRVRPGVCEESAGRYRDRTIDRAADQKWSLWAGNKTKPAIANTAITAPTIIERVLCAGPNL
jgi:hypothetical protein